MNPSVFTISLDFELHWGVFDKRDRTVRLKNYANTRDLIKPLLELFEYFEVGVTWATVGSLFANNYEEWKMHFPEILPGYSQKKYDPYLYVQENGIALEEEIAHFAADLVKMIPTYSGQELASHTFSHYYCLEDGQSAENFRADLLQAQEMSKSLTGIQLTSLVFPRNQYNNEYLKICFDCGFTAIRSNPEVWYWTGIGNDDTTLSRKLFRTGDTFVGLSSKSYPFSQIKKVSGMPVEIPASRLLRQFSPDLKILNKVRLNRILKEMSYAAKNHECYHLWWHPENFGDNPQECMSELKVILNHYRFLSMKYGMISLPMKSIAGMVLL